MQNQNATSENRVCLACGQVHNGTQCPLIKKKKNMYEHYKKRIF